MMIFGLVIMALTTVVFSESVSRLTGASTLIGMMLFMYGTVIFMMSIKGVS